MQHRLASNTQCFYLSHPRAGVTGVYPVSSVVVVVGTSGYELGGLRSTFDVVGLSPWTPELSDEAGMSREPQGSIICLLRPVQGLRA